MNRRLLLRWSLLSSCIVLLLPTLLLADGTVGIDFSWLKEVPPTLFTLTIAYLVLRIINDRQGKITVATPEGQPDKRITREEYLGKAIADMTVFMRDSKAADKLVVEQAHELTKSVNENQVRVAEMVQLALKQFQDELVTGRGNQITAIWEVRDEFHEGVQKMEASSTELRGQWTKVASGIGDLQAGKADMKSALDELLKETKALSAALRPVLDRLSRIEESVTDTGQVARDVKTNIEEINQLMAVFNERLNALSAAAVSPEPSPVPPATAHSPVSPEKEVPNGSTNP